MRIAFISNMRIVEAREFAHMRMDHGENLEGMHRARLTRRSCVHEPMQNCERLARVTFVDRVRERVRGNGRLVGEVEREVVGGDAFATKCRRDDVENLLKTTGVRSDMVDESLFGSRVEMQTLFFREGCKHVVDVFVNRLGVAGKIGEGFCEATAAEDQNERDTWRCGLCTLDDEFGRGCVDAAGVGHHDNAPLREQWRAAQRIEQGFETDRSCRWRGLVFVGVSAGFGFGLARGGARHWMFFDSQIA